MIDQVQIEEPEFDDTFERPAWWHRQLWLANLPADRLPRRKLDDDDRKRWLIREGIIPANAPGPIVDGPSLRPAILLQHSEPAAKPAPVQFFVQAKPKPARDMPHQRPRSWPKEFGDPHTYLVAAEGSHLVKIGIAKNPERRVKTLQTGQPMDLYLMWSVPGDYERELHVRFDAYRRRGEWFDLRVLGDPVQVVTDAINEIIATSDEQL